MTLALRSVQRRSLPYPFMHEWVRSTTQRLGLADVGQWIESWRISGSACSPDVPARASFPALAARPGLVAQPRPLCEPTDVPDARPRFAVPGLLLQEGAEDLGESLWFFQEG